MSRKRLLVADLLCGAGGSSTGCKQALDELGFDMELFCINHWQTAIETHKLNHPEARHYVQDIATVRPRELVPEGRLDLLMASPTCTHHSVARGGRPTSDQQRSDPWHINTWLTELRVKAIIIENVWEFTSWGPVNARTGKPVASRKGEYFLAWINSLKALGFELEWRKLNAADYGDATTRRRFIMMGRSDGKPIRWPMPTHARRPADGKLELFSTMKPWRPARDIINWQLKGRSIFNRPKPLAPATLQRIMAGAIKFKWPEPFIVTLRNHMAAQGLDVPLPTITGGGTHIGVAVPVGPWREFVIDDARKAEPFVMATGSTGSPRGTDNPLPTITTGGAGSADPGCARPMLVEPFILSRHGDGAPRSVQYPTPTQVAKHSHCLISPYYGAGSGETCNSADEPLPTVTSKGRFGMVVPVTHTTRSNGARDVADPLPTLTTAKGGELAMAMPVTHHCDGDRVRDPNVEPLPTITGANRGELAFITASFGERVGQAPRVHDIDDPTPTLCASGHVNLVQAVPQFDILFRMLEPDELAAAMGFDGDQPYQFAGTKTQKIKQIGNAVSVRKMKACVGALMADAVEAKPAARARKLIVQRAAE